LDLFSDTVGNLSVVLND
jgi:hypothetical protein